MSNSRKTSYIFSHLKRASHGNSISLNFVDLIATEASDSSITSSGYLKVSFSVRAYTDFGSQVKVVGSLKDLGSWSPYLSLSLTTTPDTYPIWTSCPISILVSDLPFTFQYKYIIIDTNKQVIWENFQSNRLCTIRERFTTWTTFQIKEVFNIYSNPEFCLNSFSPLVKGIQALANSTVLEILEGLLAVINLESINNSLIQMAALVLKSINLELQENYSIFVNFIERALNHLCQSDLKIMLNSIHIAEVLLENPSESLMQKADVFESSNENYDQEIIQTFKLSELRKSIFAEIKILKNSGSLLLTDNNLEKKEIDLIERIIDHIEDKNSIWKITLVGKWICEMLFYDFIRVKQVKTLVSQFEKLEKKENVEVLRDLLYEMMDLVIEEYNEIVKNTNHFDLEVVAKTFSVEYQLVFFNIFLLTSKFLVKTVPILNKSLLKSPYLCYSAGRAMGKLERYDADYNKWNENHILIVNEPEDYIELNQFTVGIIVTNTSNFFVPLLITAKTNKIPVAIGHNPSYLSEECALTLNEDYCWVTKSS